MRGDWAANHGCQVRHCGEEEADDRKADSTFMNEEEIADDDKQRDS
jgi:hypothetical protein